MKSAPIRMVITARDEEEAQRMLAAIARVRRGDVVGVIDEVLVMPDGTGAPTGHSYRELCDARRAGLLEAAMTGKGLVFTRGALEEYRRAKADRRRPKSKASPAPAPVTDLNEHRIKALEGAGFVVPKKRG